MGVNDRVQLAQAEAELRRRTNLRWLRRGVTMIDPDRTYIDTTVHIGADVTLFPGTLLQGRTVIGEGSEIRPDLRLVDCVVGRRAVLENTVGPSWPKWAMMWSKSALTHRWRRVAHLIARGQATGPFYTAV